MDGKSPTEQTRQRISAACDACRARKVKCAFPPVGSRCSTCADLDIDCTNVQPRKKRGPKNQYVRALKAQLDGDMVGEKSTEQWGLELIAPLAIIHQIINDWFDWIHPVAPILHRGLFFQRLAGLQQPSDGNNPSLLLLVVSVCAATVASLRRRRYLYAAVTVDGCLELAERLKMWSPNSIITLERALSVYNFSCAVHHEHGIDSPLSHRLSGEASISVNFLFHQAIDSMSFMEQQILKRLYWLIFAGQCTFDMHGRRLFILRHAHEPVNVFLPMDVTDEQLFLGSEADSIALTTGNYSYVPGLNALSGLFLVWQSSQTISVQTMENLSEHISRAHHVLDDVSPELRWQGEASQFGDFGFNVQKVNLKITQLHIRSNLLEQMNTLARDQNLRVTPDVIIEERHRVVDELLDILYHTSNEVFDANGYSIVPKIRDIGSALLDELRTGSHGRTLQASLSLDRLLVKLDDLDIRQVVQAPHT
ncbi:hypothetical protein BKA66DRAFT_436419 [Pyrenochaeta sp. MPI-SDFR-AT-0127]|nr:hypothetical protein BKA66DRAFT_436419 [Pyrenochaeta sp. MPI-SDFR-AT-0127]